MAMASRNSSRCHWRSYLADRRRLRPPPRSPTASRCRLAPPRSAPWALEIVDSALDKRSARACPPERAPFIPPRIAAEPPYYAPLGAIRVVAISLPAIAQGRPNIILRRGLRILCTAAIRIYHLSPFGRAHCWDSHSPHHAVVSPHNADKVGEPDGSLHEPKRMLIALQMSSVISPSRTPLLNARRMPRPR